MNDATTTRVSKPASFWRPAFWPARRTCRRYGAATGRTATGERTLLLDDTHVSGGVGVQRAPAVVKVTAERYSPLAESQLRRADCCLHARNLDGGAVRFPPSRR